MTLTSRINISVLDIQFDWWYSPISLSLDCWDGPSEEYLNHQSQIQDHLMNRLNSSSNHRKSVLVYSGVHKLTWSWKIHENPPSVSRSVPRVRKAICIQRLFMIIHDYSNYVPKGLGLLMIFIVFPHSPGSPPLKLRTSASAQLAGSCNGWMDLFIVRNPQQRRGWFTNTLIREFGINKNKSTHVQDHRSMSSYQDLVKKMQQIAISLGISAGLRPATTEVRARLGRSYTPWRQPARTQRGVAGPPTPIVSCAKAKPLVDEAHLGV